MTAFTQTKQHRDHVHDGEEGGVCNRYSICRVKYFDDCLGVVRKGKDY